MSATTPANRPLIPIVPPAADVCEGDACLVPGVLPDALSLTEIPFNKPDGSTARLADYAGQVLLVVNVASKCGLAPQYEGLQRLYEEHGKSDFSVIGFPANDFMGQEPGTDEEIAEFCSINYAVTFPLMAKTSVVGPEQHPLYAELTRVAPTAAGKDLMREGFRSNGMEPTEDPDVLWNFEKFLIGRTGAVVGRFAPNVTPQDPALLEAIESALVQPTRG